MLPRLLAILIISFWLVMTGLLVRLEIAPEKSRVLDVPVSHVAKLFFEQGRQSVLNVLENGASVGTVFLRPSTDASSRMIECSGNIVVQLPVLNHQRISWNATANWDRESNLQDLKLDVLLRESRHRFSLVADMAKNSVTYQLQQESRLLENGSLPLGEAGVAAALQQLGFDPSALAAMQKNVAAPAVTAKETELQVRSERIAVFQLSVRQGETALADIFISQLGQVLRATTAFGYTLDAEDLQ